MLPFLEMPRQHDNLYYVKTNKIKKVSRIWVKEGLYIIQIICRIRQYYRFAHAFRDSGHSGPRQGNAKVDHAPSYIDVDVQTIIGGVRGKHNIMCGWVSVSCHPVSLSRRHCTALYRLSDCWHRPSDSISHIRVGLVGPLNKI